MKKVKKLISEIKYPNGVVYFKLFDILYKRGISQNKFVRDTRTSFDTVRNYGSGHINRIDMSVIDRWCKYLKCSDKDIIEYKNQWTK